MSLARSLSIVLVASCGLLFKYANAERIHVAVAANFAATMKQLVHEFEATSTHQVAVSYGSSGKFFAQIVHGAPFVAFFSADNAKVDALVAKGLATEENRFIYAKGRLALWSVKPYLSAPSITQLESATFNKLAIANPKLAPYGLAAKQVLESLAIEKQLNEKLIYGENIAQTYQYVATGNADLGIVALAQIINSNDRSNAARIWLIPEQYHQPIAQSAVLLNSGVNSHAAQAFMRFMKSEIARDIIESYGYQTVNTEGVFNVETTNR